MSYLLIKYMHLLSMVLLFGVGLGSAFYKWMADRSRDPGHIYRTNQVVVFADWVFTSPTIVLQPLTGIAMLLHSGLPFTTGWVLISLGLYGLAGVCWIPVVYLQIRMREISKTAASQNVELPAHYWRLARAWFWLGVPAFSAMVLIVYLMVFKPYWRLT